MSTRVMNHRAHRSTANDRDAIFAELVKSSQENDYVERRVVMCCER
jgi:azurin